MDLARDSSSENLVLVLEVFNVFDQFVVRYRGDQGDQWVVNLVHNAMLVT